MRILGRVMTFGLAIALLSTVNLGCTARRPAVDTGAASAQQAERAAGRAETAAGKVEATAGRAEAAAGRAEAAAGRAEAAAKRVEDAAARVEAMLEKTMRK